MDVKRPGFNSILLYFSSWLSVLRRCLKGKGCNWKKQERSGVTALGGWLRRSQLADEPVFSGGGDGAVGRGMLTPRKQRCFVRGMD